MVGTLKGWKGSRAETFHAEILSLIVKRLSYPFTCQNCDESKITIPFAFGSRHKVGMGSENGLPNFAPEDVSYLSQGDERCKDGSSLVVRF